MNFIRVFRYGFLVGRRDFSTFWNWKSWFGGWMLRILTNTMIWVLMGRLIGSPVKLHYLLVGYAATAGVGTFAIVVPSWERYDGTFPFLVAAPSSLAPAIMGRMVVWMLSWVVSALLSFAVLAIAFGLQLSEQALVAIPFIISILCLSAFSFSAFLGAVVAAAPKFRLILAWTLLTMIAAFCGVSVPVTFWPVWVQVIADFLPVTHGLEAIRLVVDQGFSPNALISVGLEGIVGLIWLTLAIVVFRRSADIARANGTIEFS